jgi:hypothetical protein
VERLELRDGVDPMTVDELVKLTEALVGDFSITMLFEGAYANQLMGFDDASKALLVRFLAGERPEVVAPDPERFGQQVGRLRERLRPASYDDYDNGDAVVVVPDDDDDDDDDFSPKKNRLNPQGRIELSEPGASIVLP